MTIIGRGDLSPARRHRRYGRYVTVGLVVILVGGGGYAAYKGLKDTSETSAATQLPLCKKGSQLSKPTKLTHVGKTKVVVNNATLTAGLAAQVANELRTRGIKISSIGNTSQRGHGVATVRYSPDRKVVGEQLAAQIKGATLVEAAGSKHVEVDVGPKYTSLRAEHAATVAFRAMVIRDRASASPTPTATPSPTCRPRSVKSKRG